MGYFFITGTYRSGTTLLQKLLGAHPDIYSAEQPLPTLFIYLKDKFLRQKGIVDPLPLGTLFNETRYKQSEFLNFLENYKLSREDIDAVFKMASDFKGVRTPEIHEVKQEISPGENLIEFYKQYINLLVSITEGKNVSLRGSKEIITEEFIPYFLDNNIKTILIVRDLRDVINSTNFGKAKEFIGNIRPTLFTIRVWRKSIAFAIKYSNHPNFLVVKYENLIFNTQEVLKTIFNFLGITEFNTEQLIETISENWTANSSFGSYRGLSSASIGKYKNNFPDNYTEYIETLAYPEFLYMDYKSDYMDNSKFLTETYRNSIIENFREPVEVSHHSFNKDYSVSKENVFLEKERINKLISSKDIPNSEKEKLFIFPEAFKTLKLLLHEH